MQLNSRIAASSVLGSTVVAGLVVGILISPAQSRLAAWDDISDYDGTKCAAEQIYNATDGTCDSNIVATDPNAFDDISNFDGTSCKAEQIYNATDGQCATTAVTNDPQAPLDPNSVGTSDPGKDCSETQLFTVTDMKCVPDLDTNDPQDVPAPEGENPTMYTVPKATDVPNCASGTDPLSVCS